MNRSWIVGRWRGSSRDRRTLRLVWIILLAWWMPLSIRLLLWFGYCCILIECQIWWIVWHFWPCRWGLKWGGGGMRLWWCARWPISNLGTVWSLHLSFWHRRRRMLGGTWKVVFFHSWGFLRRSRLLPFVCRGRAVMSLASWYASIPFHFGILVFPLRHWLTMMHGTDATLPVSCVSPRDRERVQCSISIKSLLLATPLFGNV